MTDQQPPAPIVRTEGLSEVAPDFYVIPDNGVPLVPNIGIVGGKNAVLVIDTGMGPANAVLQQAARSTSLLLTSTQNTAMVPPPLRPMQRSLSTRRKKKI
jgi:hypothetical protein